jgi:hypothetical protein
MKPKILHHEVKNSNTKMDAGHWFFHTGNWTICAQAHKTEFNKWTYKLNPSLSIHSSF